MKKTVEILVVIVVFALCFDTFYLTRWTTIDLGRGVRLTFVIHWGWEMEQSIVVSGGPWWPFTQTASQDVWKKPYNAGGPLYADAKDTVYFLVLRRQAYRIDISQGSVVATCDFAPAREMTYIGQFGILNIASVSGDGATFTPAGEDAPVRGGVGVDPAHLQASCG